MQTEGFSPPNVVFKTASYVWAISTELAYDDVHSEGWLGDVLEFKFDMNLFYIQASCTLRAPLCCAA